MLMTDAFIYQKPGSKTVTRGQISVTTLIMFGLLHCADNKNNPVAKAEALYELLNEGGLAKFDQISAQDKDFKPNFERIAALVTSELFELAVSVPCQYDRDEVKCLENVFKDVAEDWLDEVFDNHGRLVNEVWIEKVTGVEGRWIFNATEFRARIFKTAEIPVKHGIVKTKALPK